MIELRVSDGWKVQVHKALLCHYSSYYGAALLSGFKEASSTYLDLDLCSMNAGLFVRWLYSGKLCDQSWGMSMFNMLEFYIFADTVDIPALRRQLMTEVVEKKPIGAPNGSLNYYMIATITNALPSSSPLYRYAVDWYISHVDESEVDLGEQDQSYEELPKEFMHIVMRRLLLRMRSPNSDTEAPCECCNRPCEYHEHDTETEFHDSKFLQPFLQRYPILINSGYSVLSL